MTRRETCADQKRKKFQNGRSNQRKCSGWRLCWRSWNTVTCGQGHARGAVKPGFSSTSRRRRAAAKGSAICSPTSGRGARDLFPRDWAGGRSGGDALFDGDEVRSFGGEPAAGLAIGEEEVIV